jgi:hypothetical protein
VQELGDLGRHRDAAAQDADDGGIGGRMLEERQGELTPGIESVREGHVPGSSKRRAGRRRPGPRANARALRGRSSRGARFASFGGAADPHRAVGLARAAQPGSSMAAVMALIFLFALASTSLFVKSLGAWTFGTAIAGGFFLALAAGVFLALLRMARRWENE